MKAIKNKILESLAMIDKELVAKPNMSLDDDDIDDICFLAKTLYYLQEIEKEPTFNAQKSY